MKINKTDLVKFDGTIDEFISKISYTKEKGTIGILKTEHGRNLEAYWWENSERWFMNVLTTKSATVFTSKESCFVTANDLKSRLNFFITQHGEQMYFEKI